MDELTRLISEGKRAIIRILNYLEHYDLVFTGTGDFLDMLEHFIYVQGYVACLEHKAES